MKRKSSKREIIFVIVCILLGTFICSLSDRMIDTPFKVEAASTKKTAKRKSIPKYRTVSGTYYDYMTIVTKDKGVFFLSDKQTKRNPFMKKVRVRFNGKRKWEYMPVFEDGDKVTVKFSTNGTKKKNDDTIVSIKKGGKTYARHKKYRY